MTMDEIRNANRNAGSHWFDPDTLRFFSSRISDSVYEGPGGIFFVTSEQRKGWGSIPDAPRLYSVRRFEPKTGGISTHGEFQEYRTSRAAHAAARRAAKGEE